MKKCDMKKKCLMKYIPYVLFAISLVIMGAIGKLTGATPAVDMFEQINVLGKGEAFGRIMVGLAELFAGVGVFFAITRKVAAVMGIAIMAAAISFQMAFLGGSILVAVITMALGIYILLKSCPDCPKKCGNGTCNDGTCCKETVCNSGTCDSEKSE